MLHFFEMPKTPTRRSLGRRQPTFHPVVICDFIGSMPDSQHVVDHYGGERGGLVLQLFELAGINTDARWKAVAENPEAAQRLETCLAAIAALEVAQAGTGETVPFVYKSHVINFRPFVVPVLVAAVVHVAVTVAPSLDSALIPWLDIVAFLEKVEELYRHLDDDEVDVFGAVAALWTLSKRYSSVTDPGMHSTVEGVQQWFLSKGFEAPPNVKDVLESLEKKGAVVSENGLYRPSFLGKRSA